MKKKLKVLLMALTFALTLPFFASLKNKKVKAYTASDIVFYGNDVSYWQGNVNFTKMKTVSDFVILRIGYGTSLDKKFTTYMEGAIKNKINIGIYIYSLATNVNEAINEANWVISTLKFYGYDKGTLTFPIYFDYEEDGVISSNTRAVNTAIINAFASTILSEGYYPGVYMGASHFKNNVNANSLICDVWLAQYFGSNDPAKFSAKLNNSHPKVKMWQFAAGPYSINNSTISSHVKYSGAECGVSSSSIDENWCFVNYPKIIKNGGYNGHIGEDFSQNSTNSSSSSNLNGNVSSSSNVTSSTNSGNIISGSSQSGNLTSKEENLGSSSSLVSTINDSGCKGNIGFGSLLLAFCAIISAVVIVHKKRKI